jgi:cyclophilin family peptidyl-prolyl cis-trans isomerase
VRLTHIALLVFAAQESDAARKARADLAEVRVSVEKLVKIQERMQKIDEQLRTGAEDPDRPKKLALQRQEAIREFTELRDPTIKAMEGVIASVTSELGKSPDDAGLLDVRAEAYLMYKHPEEGLVDLERLAKLRPDDPGLALRMGRVAHRLNRYDSAVANLEKYLKKDPAHLESRLLLSSCYLSVHRFEESVGLLDGILKEKIEPEQKDDLAEFRKRAASFVELWKAEREARTKDQKADDLPRVKLVTTRGDIELELFENEAPNTVANFVELVTKKFYDGLTFHRVEPGFMAQGGCPRGDGSGDAGYKFKDELAGATRLHFRGSLSMANSGPDTNGSQFFITHLPTEWLNGKHTVFGRVLKGQDVVDRLRQGDTIVKAEVTRKRDHPYAVTKIGDARPEEKK